MSNPQSDRANDSESSAKSSLVELKNGKVIFKQKPYSFEKHSESLQELVKFREMLQERIGNADPALSALDDEHKPLIAKLVHESDKTLTALAKRIHTQLLPTDDDADTEGDASSSALLLPTSIIETVIQEVAVRNNYGIETDLGVKAPAATCVWRWEVKEQYRHWLPKNVQEKVASRLADRVKAKNDLMVIFAALPEDERRSILHIKVNAKGPSEQKGRAVAPTPTSDPTLDQTSGPSRTSEPSTETEHRVEQTKSKATRPKKDAEKDSKTKKQTDAQKSLMANFFTKPKASTKPTSKSFSSAAAAGPSNGQSDFERTFKPFMLKKGTQLAPINAFLEKSANGTREDIIVIDEDEPTASTSTRTDIAGMTAKGRLCQILSSMPQPVAGPLKRPPKSTVHRMKTYHPVAVRDLLKQLSEVELFGDATSVRKIHGQLSDRNILPAKVLIFNGDSRPGYYGTWTKSSRLIGPRTPHAKDVLEIDYGYDSGEDWEEEPAGEADDVMDEGEDEEGTEDRDSDIDDWLVDDDEVEDGVPIDEPGAGSPTLPILLPKRKIDDPGAKPEKKRKVVVPLVPFAKGPCWETSIGRCDNAFDSYRIRLLNDAPFPINPFTFVSVAIEERKSTKPSQQGFAIPALPNHVAQGNTTKGGDSSPAPTVPKKAASGPKSAFPDEHLPVLLSKINTAQAANLTVLVEVVSQELRQHKVKKNAIEAKIREVGEKCKIRKFWIVKENHPSTKATSA
ncbi:hypothetical protein GYMLUDRAFT_44116 [Collybiopsis luxurians FD-317 M1]|uniref:Chromatin assembly factor 1 subunit A dimerization domain-containing protein n=1 Tax=Collybiopsis luxurians FD-317 M1 TaxID=944289 RepID=A0A0D0CB17_9AGAR|nr:hypothetical protein GYMLUDRAFT_44116 [Collybiopsis luxurians FD-317 M1]